jgi:hypothetical protein
MKILLTGLTMRALKAKNEMNLDGRLHDDAYKRRRSSK